MAKAAWCYEDFCDFFLKLTMPEGKPATLENWQSLGFPVQFRAGT